MDFLKKIYNILISTKTLVVLSIHIRFWLWGTPLLIENGFWAPQNRPPVTIWVIINQVFGFEIYLNGNNLTSRGIQILELGKPSHFGFPGEWLIPKRKKKWGPKFFNPFSTIWHFN